MGVDVSTFYPTSVRRTTSPPAPPMPNLSSLRQKGVLFRNAWANTECAPARATIFTGRYDFRAGVGPWIRDGYPVLSKSETRRPEVLKARPALGHVLGHVGKWHLTFIGPTEPNLHGWPHYAGPGTNLTNLSNFFSWPKVVNGVRSTSTTYATTDQVNEAIKVIQRAKSAGKPYVTWVALNTPHSPYHKPPNALHSRDSLPTYTSGMNPGPIIRR